MLEVYTSASGATYPHYSGWAFTCQNEVHYCPCLSGTVSLMQDMAIYQSLKFLKGKKARIYGELCGTGLTELILKEFPNLELFRCPQNEEKEFCDLLAEKGRLIAQSPPIEFSEIKLNDVLVKLEPVFSTRYLVKDIVGEILLLQNISTDKKQLEQSDGIGLRKLG